MTDQTPPPQSVVVRRADLEEVRDLLMERIYGSNARSPGHNARLAVEAMLAAAPAPSSLAGGEVDLVRGHIRSALRGLVGVDETADRILAALSPEAPAREEVDEKIDAIRKLAMAAAKIAPGLWGSDVEKGEGEYGIGDETQTGFMVPYMENEHGKRLFDAHTSDVAVIEEDYGFDEDGAHHHAWDESSRVIFEYLAAVQPAEILALIDASALTPRHEAPASHAFEASHSIKREGGCKVCGHDEASHEAPAEGAGERDRVREIDTLTRQVTPDLATAQWLLASIQEITEPALRARSSAPEAREGEVS